MYPARRFTLFLQAHLFLPPLRHRQRGRSCHLPNLPRQPPNCLQKALRRLLSRFLLVRLHTRLLLRPLPRGRHHPRRRALLGVGSLGLESAPLIGYPRSGIPQQRRAAAGSSPSCVRIRWPSRGWAALTSSSTYGRPGRMVMHGNEAADPGRQSDMHRSAAQAAAQRQVVRRRRRRRGRSAHEVGRPLVVRTSPFDTCLCSSSLQHPMLRVAVVAVGRR